MKMCTGLVWLMVRYGSGLCKLSKEASSSATGRQNIQIFQNDTDVSGCQSSSNKILLITYFSQQNALIKIQ
jgi:hypothetical protein